MDKAEYEVLLNYVSKKHPAAYSKDEKRRLLEKAVSFCVINGDLLHNGAKDKRTQLNSNGLLFCDCFTQAFV